MCDRALVGGDRTVIDDGAVAERLFRYRASEEFNNPSIANTWYWHSQLILSEVAAACPSRVGGDYRIVDFGCGDGYLAQRIVREIESTRVTTIDINPDDIRFIEAAKRYVRNGDRIEPLVANVYRVPLPSMIADIVICSEVVEHLTDDGAALREMHRILKPGGTLILATPNAGNLISRLAQVLRLAKAVPPDEQELRTQLKEGTLDAEMHGHINERSARYWRAGLASAGFTVEKILPVTPRYGGEAISKRPLWFAMTLLLQAVARHVPYGYQLSWDLIVCARRR
jgi:2-polyprenyl-3-methyl-5-hydroxy-6-metoxy-1,4-benzoquinol methylase